MGFVWLCTEVAEGQRAPLLPRRGLMRVQCWSQGGGGIAGAARRHSQGKAGTDPRPPVIASRQAHAPLATSVWGGVIVCYRVQPGPPTREARWAVQQQTLVRVGMAPGGVSMP